MSPSDIYFVQVGEERWHALSHRYPALGPIGWVRRRQVFEGGEIGSLRAARLWLSLDASRSWFAAQLGAEQPKAAAERFSKRRRG